VTVGSQSNYDLNADLQASYGWNGVDSIIVHCYVTGALSGTTPFDTGADATGGSIDLTLFNQSTIKGAGGNGGNANSGSGAAGSDAINIQYNIKYDNSAGEISGGGNGGNAGALIPGGPGDPKDPPDPPDTGGGGGGGAGTPAGSGGYGNPPGSPGSATAGGAGGVSPGNSGSPGSGLGTSGKAINLNGNTATDVGASAGTINGAIS